MLVQNLLHRPGASLRCALLLALLVTASSPARAQRTDIFFVVDETGTMADEITSLKASTGSTIVPAAVTTLGDVAFGVARYRDFPVSPFGQPGDVAYELLSPLSTNTGLFQNAMNSLSAGGGGDVPEANLHALHAAATGALGWRSGAARVIFWIGDAPGHDGDLEPAYASCCSSVGLADAGGALSTAGITVYAFSTDTLSSALDDTGQATAIVSATGGALASGLSPAGLTNEILAVIQGPLAEGNGPPSANAGPDQEVRIGEPVTLVGSASDPEDDPIVSWHWQLESSPAGSSPVLGTPDAQSTSFETDTPGDYEISLVVSDGMLSSDPDLVVVTVLEKSPKTDILFLVDDTSSMDEEILQLRVSVGTIAGEARAALDDVAFGVALYRDFPVDPYGDPPDQPYVLLSPISPDPLLFASGMQALVGEGGNDTPESGLHALYRVATTSPGWRVGARRLVFWIGDAPSHDGDLEPAYASCCSSVGLDDAIAALTAARIAVYPFGADSPVSGLDDTGQAGAITSATGGSLATGLSPVGLVNEILAVLRGLKSRGLPALSPFSRAVLMLTLVALTVALGRVSGRARRATDTRKRQIAPTRSHRLPRELLR